MIHFSQALLRFDPDVADSDGTILTMDDIRSREERFGYFGVRTALFITLSDDTEYFFIRDEKGWGIFYEDDPEEKKVYISRFDINFSLLQAIDMLLTDLNSSNMYGMEN